VWASASSDDETLGSRDRCRATRQPGGRLIVNFAYPSSADWTAGVIVLYELANACARRGHEVHFVHGPLTPYRVKSVDELPPFRFEDSVEHHLVDRLDDQRLPAGDVVFGGTAPRRLGLAVEVVQGIRILREDVERELFRAPVPKACVATWLVDVGLRYGSRPEQLWHVPLGLDHGVFAIRTPPDQRRYDAAMMWHPHRDKGFVVGLEALAQLKRQVPEVRALVFGMVPPDRPLPDWIRFWHGPDHRTLADQIYNQSRVFVQPSFHEGFGYSAVEAMACGCALVTTDNGGSRDYAVPGETALVVPPGDAAGLADAAVRLLRDDRQLARLARAGSHLVRSRFDWDNTGSVLEAYLLEYVADAERYQRRPADVLAREDTG
jgi:glycosyltransferase involved in cell wall biosynthesis